jgi:inner membrane protein
LGKLFKEFTPFYHINYEEKDDKIVCHFIDLRYRLKGRFLHNGTMVLSRDYEVMEAIFHPYSMSHRVYLV